MNIEEKQSKNWIDAIVKEWQYGRYGGFDVLVIKSTMSQKIKRFLNV